MTYPNSVTQNGFSENTPRAKQQWGQRISFRAAVQLQADMAYRLRQKEEIFMEKL